MTTTPNALPMSEVLAFTVRTLRLENDWTQEGLAEAMRQRGFKWTRVTVSQIEYGSSENRQKGRGREVTAAELLGLADAFGVGAFRLLHWRHPIATDLGLGVTPRMVIANEKLAYRLVTVRLLVDMVESAKADVKKVMEHEMSQRLERLGRVYLGRIQALAKDLRQGANWIEQSAAESLASGVPRRGGELHSQSGKGQQS